MVFFSFFLFSLAQVFPSLKCLLLQKKEMASLVIALNALLLEFKSFIAWINHFFDVCFQSSDLYHYVLDLSSTASMNLSSLYTQWMTCISERIRLSFHSFLSVDQCHTI